MKLFLAIAFSLIVGGGAGAYAAMWFLGNLMLHNLYFDEENSIENYEFIYATENQ